MTVLLRAEVVLVISGCRLSSRCGPFWEDFIVDIIHLIQRRSSCTSVIVLLKVGRKETRIRVVECWRGSRRLSSWRTFSRVCTGCVEIIFFTFMVDTIDAIVSKKIIHDTIAGSMMVILTALTLHSRVGLQFVPNPIQFLIGR